MLGVGLEPVAVEGVEHLDQLGQVGGHRGKSRLAFWTG
jgi:hypothetical protein